MSETKQPPYRNPSQGYSWTDIRQEQLSDGDLQRHLQFQYSGEVMGFRQRIAAKMIGANALKNAHGWAIFQTETENILRPMLVHTLVKSIGKPNTDFSPANVPRLRIVTNELVEREGADELQILVKDLTIHESDMAHISMGLIHLERVKRLRGDVVPVLGYSSKTHKLLLSNFMQMTPDAVAADIANETILEQKLADINCLADQIYALSEGQQIFAAIQDVAPIYCRAGAE